MSDPVPPIHNACASPVIAQCQVIFPQTFSYLQQAVWFLKSAEEFTTTTYSKQIAKFFHFCITKLSPLLDCMTDDYQYFKALPIKLHNETLYISYILTQRFLD